MSISLTPPTARSRRCVSYHAYNRPHATTRGTCLTSLVRIGSALRKLYVCFPTIPPITLVDSYFHCIILINVLYKVYHNKKIMFMSTTVFMSRSTIVWLSMCYGLTWGSYYKNMLFIIILSVCIGDSNQVLVLS